MNKRIGSSDHLVGMVVVNWMGLPHLGEAAKYRCGVGIPPEGLQLLEVYGLTEGMTFCVKTF